MGGAPAALAAVAPGSIPPLRASDPVRPMIANRKEATAMKTQSIPTMARERHTGHEARPHLPARGWSALPGARWLARGGLIGLAVLLVAGCSMQGSAGSSGAQHNAQHLMTTLNDAMAKGDMDELAPLFAMDVQRGSPAGTQSGRAAVRAHYEQMLKGFADLRLDPKRVLADGDTAICECMGSALYKPNGKRVEVPIVVVMTFNAAGEATRYTEYYDSATFKRQLQ
jgi:uncharacterized protein (TIGR02246 family)